MHALLIPADTAKPVLAVDVADDGLADQYRLLDCRTVQVMPSGRHLPCTIWGDEDGKFTGKAFNERATELWAATYGVGAGELSDYLVGDVLVTGAGGGEFDQDVPADVLARFTVAATP